MSSQSGLAKTLIELDVGKLSGIEIGPLDKPRITSDQGEIHYLDYMTTEELRDLHRYEDGVHVDVDRIVDVDLVARDNAPLPDVVGDVAPVDYVLAAHVIEHVPDMIGWLREIAEVLRDGGLVSLVIPDQRFTFDIHRRLTDVSDLIESHLSGLRRSPYRNIYQHTGRIVYGVDAIGVWDGAIGYGNALRADLSDRDGNAYQHCLYARDSGDYVDVHNNIFTPASFLDVYERLVRLGLIDYRIARFFPTERWEVEFFATLERLPRDCDPATRAALQLQSIPRIWERPPADAPDAPFRASVREERMLRIKRRLILGARTRLDSLHRSLRRPGDRAHVEPGSVVYNAQ